MMKDPVGLEGPGSTLCYSPHLRRIRHPTMSSTLRIRSFREKGRVRWKVSHSGCSFYTLLLYLYVEVLDNVNVIILLRKL